MLNNAGSLFLFVPFLLPHHQNSKSLQHSSPTVTVIMLLCLSLTCCLLLYTVVYSALLPCYSIAHLVPSYVIIIVMSCVLLSIKRVMFCVVSYYVKSSVGGEVQSKLLSCVLECHVFLQFSISISS